MSVYTSTTTASGSSTTTVVSSTSVTTPLPLAGVGASYTVKQGDTMTRISWKLYGVSTVGRAILAYNGIIDARMLTPGMILQVPGA